MRIDPEFKSLIPPLAADEFSQLEKNIIRSCSNCIYWKERKKIFCVDRMCELSQTFPYCSGFKHFSVNWSEQRMRDVRELLANGEVIPGFKQNDPGKL